MKHIKILLVIKASRKTTTAYVAARRHQNGEWGCKELTFPASAVEGAFAIVSDETYNDLCQQLSDKYEFDCDAIDHKEIAA